MKKTAVISIDFEDWYLLEYLKNYSCDKSQSVILQGTKKFTEIVNSHKIRATFFVVGELVSKYKKLLLKILANGHEISGHSLAHKRPTTQTLNDFETESKVLINILSNELNVRNPGYRAPCFSMDEKRLEILKNLTTVTIQVATGYHPLYGHIDISKFKKLRNNVYCKIIFSNLNYQLFLYLIRKYRFQVEVIYGYFLGFYLSIY